MKTLRIFIVLLSVCFLAGCATVQSGLETIHDIQKAAGQIPIARIYVTNVDPVALIGVECMGQRTFSDTSGVEGLQPGQSKTFVIPLYRENQQETITVKFYEYDKLQKCYVFRGARSQTFWFSAYNPQDQNWDVRR
jgi:hypothetical protein